MPGANKSAGDGGDLDYRCSLEAGRDPPPEVVSEARSQINEVCSRLAEMDRCWASRTAAARRAPGCEPTAAQQGSENGRYVNSVPAGFESRSESESVSHPGVSNMRQPKNR